MVEAKRVRLSPLSTPAQKTRPAFRLGKNPTPANFTSKGTALIGLSAAFIFSAALSSTWPINFNVTCRPSTRAQRASGASARARSMYSVRCARISAGISSPMKMRISHQLAADHVQGLLRGPVAYAVAIAGESTLDHFCVVAVSQRVEDEAHRLFIRSPRGPGYARNTYAETRFAIVANALRKRCGHLAAHGAMFSDQQRRNSGQSCLDRVFINNSATQEVTRAAGNRCNPFRQHAPGAGFGNGQRFLPHAQVIAHNLLHALALCGKDGVFKFVFQQSRECINALLRLFN